MKKTNTKSLPSTTKRSNFEQVSAGSCPHDNAKLGDEIKCKGVGVTRECSECHHVWYLNEAIRTTKCQTCASEKRKAVTTSNTEKETGGGVWESNPPKTLLTPLNGFEVREAHRDSSAPLVMQLS